jgi:transposase
MGARPGSREAVRDLARAREAASDDLRRKRQQLLSFLLRHSRIYRGGGHWTLAHRRWLASQKFDHAAQQIAFQEGIDAIEDSLQRLRRFEKQLVLLVPEWSMAPVVEAYQAMRGASFLVAVTFAAEIGDVRRFDTPRQLTSFLGLVPPESSTGDTIRRKGPDLGRQPARSTGLVEAAWSYRYPSRISETLRARLEGLPKPVRDIAWKAQVRRPGSGWSRGKDGRGRGDEASIGKADRVDGLAASAGVGRLPEGFKGTLRLGRLIARTCASW